MSFWNNQDRLIEDMKHKYMKNVLDFNTQMIQLRQKRKYTQQQQFQKSAQQSNKQSLNILLQETDRFIKKKEHQKNILKEYYDRQIQERENKIKLEKMQEKEYFYKEMEHREYEESRRIMELARMFNRKTYEARPAGFDHRRIKTESHEARKYHNNPQKTILTEPKKNLQNFEIIKPQTPYYNQKQLKQPLNVQKDSLDTLNHSFNQHNQHQRNKRY